MRHWSVWKVHLFYPITQDADDTWVEIKVKADTRRQYKQTQHIEVDLVAFAVEFG